jgi:hypothetical protein
MFLPISSFGCICTWWRCICLLSARVCARAIYMQLRHVPLFLFAIFLLLPIIAKCRTQKAGRRRFKAGNQLAAGLAPRQSKYLRTHGTEQKSRPPMGFPRFELGCLYFLSTCTPKARLKETEIKETSISACIRNAEPIFWG